MQVCPAPSCLAVQRTLGSWPHPAKSLFSSRQPWLDAEAVGEQAGRCTLFRWKVNSQQDGSKTMTSWDSGDRNKEGPQDWLGAHDGFTKKKKRSDTRVQLRMELQRPLLQVADRPEVIPDLARSSKPMLSSTVWRAREPQAEVDTIPTFWLSAFEASSMACQAQRA